MPAGGALGYLTVEPPRALSYGPPAVDSSWLSQLPQEYRQGQQYARERQLQTMFQGPQGAALLANSGIDPNSLFGALAQRGGASAIQGVVPALLGAQQLRGWNQQFGGDQQSNAGPQAQPTSGQAQGGNALFNSIYQQESSSGRNTATSWAGARGPMQIKPETFNAFAQPGENINNSDDNIAVGKRILNHYVEKYGDPARAAVAYYSGEGNVAPAGSPTPWKVNRQPINPRTGRPEPSVSQYVVSVLGRMRSGTQVAAATPAPGTVSDQLNPADRAAVDQIYSASALAAPPSAATPAPSQETANRFPEGEGSEGEGGPATGAPAPVEQPPGAIGTAPFMASSSPNASGPANINGPQPTRVASLGPTNLPAGQQASPPPSSPGTPAGRDVVTQAPTAGTRVAQATPQGGLGILQPGDSVNALRQAETKIANMRRARPNMYFANEAQQKAMDEQIATEQKNHDQMLERINKENELTAGVRAKGAGEQEAADIKLDAQTYAGIRGKSADYEASGRGFVNLAKSILNDPQMYTGIGADRSLNWNRIKSTFGDTQAAMLQEGLQKVTASSVLRQLNDTRFDLEEGGIQGGRVFKQSADLVQQASPQLGTSLAGNRFLVEVQSRNGDLGTKIFDMARDYRATHNGRLGAGFDAQLKEYTQSHPLYSKQELAHPTLLGAPTIPADMFDSKRGFNRAAVKDWATKMGLQPGDPVRRPDDPTAYIALP